jgi:hypothetical protein
VTDPRKLRPSELCRLLNSTPLGEVINQGQLRSQRTRAGLRIGGAHHVDFLRYVAWLLHDRHSPKPESGNSPAVIDLAEAAEGAAAIGSRRKQVRGHGQKLTRKQEAVIAAMLTETTHTAAARKAGISEATLYRWMDQTGFRTAFRQARRELVEGAVGRVQAATGQAVEILLYVARNGRRDGDRVRAANSLLDHAFRGLTDANILHGEGQSEAPSSMSTTQIVMVLAARLRQLDSVELPTAEKSRLTAILADAVLRALDKDELNKRIEALETVLLARKDQEP